MAQLASTVGDTIRVRSLALPDYALIDHVNGGSNAVDVIRGEPWTVVVLKQGQKVAHEAVAKYRTP